MEQGVEAQSYAVYKLNRYKTRILALESTMGKRTRNSDIMIKF